MSSQLSEHIGVLVRERAELDGLLASNSTWRALLIARADAARGVASALADARRLEAALAGNRLFRAREALEIAIESLTSALADAAPGTLPSPPRHTAPPAPAPRARIHATPRALRAQAASALRPGGDDLTLVRGIDRALAERLAALGVDRFAQIAAWSAEEVRAMASALDLGARISRQNWIEQAAMLAARRAPPINRATAGAPAAADTLQTPDIASDTGPLQPDPAVVAEPIGNGRDNLPTRVKAHHDRETAVVATTDPAADAAAEPHAPEPVGSTAEVVELPEPDARMPDATDYGLALIRGLGPEMAEWLAAAGVTRPEEVATWSAGDLACYGAEPGLLWAARRHSWIEQAAVLAAGRLTAHARRHLRGDFDALVPPPACDPFAAPGLVGDNREHEPGPPPMPAEPAAEAPPAPAAEPSPTCAESHPLADPLCATGEGGAEDLRRPARSDLEDSAAKAFAMPIGVLVPILPSVAEPPEPPADRTSIDQRSRPPRLVERIASLPSSHAEPSAHATATVPTVTTALAQEPRPSAIPPEPAAPAPTLGSWTAPAATEAAMRARESEIWTGIAEARLTVAKDGEAGWLDIPPGEADVVIRASGDGRGAPIRRGAASRPERQPPPPPRVHPASEEASVEIISHGERPRIHPRAVAEPVRRPAPSDRSVLRFLRSLTGH